MDALVPHLTRLYQDSSTDKIGPGSTMVIDRMAANIRANPQAHVDVLIEAGLLRRNNGAPQWLMVAQPVPPHNHKWRVIWATVDTVRIQCACNSWREIGSTLPLEIPDE